MKRIFAAVLALALMTGCSAAESTETQPENGETAGTEDIITETEKSSETVSDEPAAEISHTETEASVIETAETEAETEALSSTEAEKYYSVIMSDTFWRKENSAGAAMIDLQGDGVPEFLVSSTADDAAIDCYSFGDEKLNYLYTFEPIGYNNMTRYIDNGTVKWWGYTYESERSDEESYPSSYKTKEEYGLFVFTEKGPVMTDILFSSTEEYDKETDIYKGEMYINGEHYADDYIEDYSKLDGVPGLEYYGWYTKKADWEGENLSDDENYSLLPNEHLWSNNDDIDSDIRRLANAYCENDTDYLAVPGYFGEVNAFKPVIYLYPEATADISVRLDLDGRLVCTYPDYGIGWNVTAMPDGTLYDKRGGHEYSYLYWEGNLNAEWDMSAGFVVKGCDTADFLRDKLSYMGLTPDEYNEFIVYWLPQMQGSRYNLISFQTEAYENAARLDISPKPDSVLRIFMAFMPLDEFAEVPEQKLSTFERNGFTVVEWGGTKVSSDD